MKDETLFNQLRNVPEYAKKTITGGRLKGMTDIKPMWRIEKMTEVFGVCGIGWYPEILKFEYRQFNNETVCQCHINLYVCINGNWSKPIPGVGGSMFSTTEKNGVYVSDECEKMAYTDALSVAMKFLGMGADVYMGLSESKYGTVTDETKPANVYMGTVDRTKIDTTKPPAAPDEKALKRQFLSALEKGLTPDMLAQFNAKTAEFKVTCFDVWRIDPTNAFSRITEAIQATIK